MEMIVQGDISAKMSKVGPNVVMSPCRIIQTRKSLSLIQGTDIPVNWGWGVFQAIIFFSEHKLNSGCIFNTFFVITKSKSIIHVRWTMQYELPHSPNWSQIWSFCMQLSKAVTVNSWRGGATVT